MGGMWVYFLHLLRGEEYRCLMLCIPGPAKDKKAIREKARKNGLWLVQARLRQLERTEIQINQIYDQ